jgi:hypothetical protein
MSVVYLANVGTRDVMKDGKPASAIVDGRPAPSCRRDGEVWLRDYDAIKGQLLAPILTPGLRAVLDLVERVTVVLFYSDQDEMTAEKFRGGDTVFFAQILRRLLPEVFSGRIEKVLLSQLAGNPADYNRMLPFFAEQLPRLVPVQSVDVVFVAPVGGADASNVGLTINAVHCYRNKCQFIYVTDGRVERLNLHEELLTEYNRQEAVAHLDRHDYAALAATLRNTRLARAWHQHLCDYADRRVCFDFVRADGALQAALASADCGETRLVLQRLRQSLQPFLHQGIGPISTAPQEDWDRWFTVERQLLGELFFNLSSKAGKGEWVDFLGRLFRLQEAVLRLVFELETRHSSDKQPQSEFADFIHAIDSQPDLQAYLQSRATKYEDGPNSFNLAVVLKFWVQHGKGREYGKLARTLEAIGGQQLGELRNKSIVAHGYRGISREDVEAAAGLTVADLLESLKTALSSLGVRTDSEVDPYAAIQALLRNLLD